MTMSEAKSQAEQMGRQGLSKGTTKKPGDAPVIVDPSPADLGAAASKPKKWWDQDQKKWHFPDDVDFKPQPEASPKPQLAAGGVVPPRPGGTDVTVGEGGEPEAVIPLSQLMMMLQPEGANQPPKWEPPDFTLGNYLPSQSAEGPPLTGAFSSPPPSPISGQEGAAPPPQDPDMMQPDPLMEELRRGRDPKAGLMTLAGSALGGWLAGSGGAEAAGAAAGTQKDMFMQNIQQHQALQAQDRERKFKLGEEKIQGAHKMMQDLHGVDMAGLPDHVKQEMARLTDLYNQKLQGGLTEKEASEVLAMGARMQQLLQGAKADPSYGEGRAKARGTEAGIASSAQSEAEWQGMGGRPPDALPMESVKAYMARKNLEKKLKSAEEIARQRAEATGKQFSNRDWNVALQTAARTLGINLQTVSDDPITSEALIAEATRIYEGAPSRPGQGGSGSPASAGGGGGRSWVKGPDGVFRQQ